MRESEPGPAVAAALLRAIRRLERLGGLRERPDSAEALHGSASRPGGSPNWRSLT